MEEGAAGASVRIKSLETAGRLILVMSLIPLLSKRIEK
jgi:hypothetical protein